MGHKTSVYLSDELTAAVRASQVPLAELVRRGLAAEPAGPAEVMRRALAMFTRIAGCLETGWQLVPPDTDDQS